jgi:putative transposase
MSPARKADPSPPRATSRATSFSPCRSTMAITLLLLAPKADRIPISCVRSLTKKAITRALRTDNEALFTSKLFRFCLAILGVRHQRSAPFAPWQNGRIERFFGTFKRSLRERLQLDGTPLPGGELDAHRVWYNHLRLHQNLDGRTPAEAWTGRALNWKKAPQFVTA